MKNGTRLFCILMVIFMLLSTTVLLVVSADDAKVVDGTPEIMTILFRGEYRGKSEQSWKYSSTAILTNTTEWNDYGIGDVQKKYGEVKIYD